MLLEDIEQRARVPDRIGDRCSQYRRDLRVNLHDAGVAVSIGPHPLNGHVPDKIAAKKITGGGSSPHGVTMPHSGLRTTTNDGLIPAHLPIKPCLPGGQGTGNTACRPFPADLTIS